MGRAIIGVLCNTHRLDARLTLQAAGDRNLRAIAEAADAIPILIPAMPDAIDIDSILSIVDGVLLGGGRANVHPSQFGAAAHPKHEPYDRPRDSLALALVRACVDEGVPLFGVCRGLQEMNVAFGGTLHPEIAEIPGRMNHRAPRIETGEVHPDPAVVFAERHEVRLTEGGVLSGLLGSNNIRVNSLHGQGVLEPGARIVIEGRAEDDTVEAISIEGARSFALGVQWHAEYEPQRSSVNHTLFQAFGQAAKARRMKSGKAGGR